MRLSGLKVKETMPEGWIVNCKPVGGGEMALICLGKYLYRGVLPKKEHDQ